MAAPGKLARATAYALGVSLLAILLVSPLVWYELRHVKVSLPQSSIDSAATFIKGALAQVLVVRRADESSLAARTGGLLNAYEGDPEKLRRDAKLLDDWSASARLGQSVLRNTGRGSWAVSSSAADYVAPQDRVDPWQHTFCLLRRDDELLVMSGGPKATSSPTCRNIGMRASDLASLPHGRLLESPAGYLLLVLSHARRLDDTR
jgi:hypothetical protein